MKYKATLSIRPDLWDFGKQRVKALKQLPHHIELNNHLEKIRSAAFKAFWEYMDSHDGINPYMRELKLLVDLKLNRVKKQIKMDFLAFFQRIIDQSEVE